jgi:hypothetical protein
MTKNSLITSNIIWMLQLIVTDLKNLWCHNLHYLIILQTSLTRWHPQCSECHLQKKVEETVIKSSEISKKYHFLSIFQSNRIPLWNTEMWYSCKWLHYKLYLRANEMHFTYQLTRTAQYISGLNSTLYLFNLLQVLALIFLNTVSLQFN